AAQRTVPPQRRRLAHEDEEGGLEGVLGVLCVAQDAAANAQHHRPVPHEQGREGGLVVPRHEALEERRVGQGKGGATVEETADLLQGGPEAFDRHGVSLRENRLYCKTPGGRGDKWKSWRGLSRGPAVAPASG